MADPQSQPGSRQPLWLQDLAGAWVFYSVLPALPGIAPRFERIARFAPWIGLVIGALQALLWLLSSGWLPPLTQAALVVALGLWLSGGLHADGVLDTADGLAAGPRLLEAMADSRVGAAGVQAFALLLLLRLGALLALAAAVPSALVACTLLLVAVWGRISPVLAIVCFPYLRPQGGSAAFHSRARRSLLRELRPALLLLALLAGLLWLAHHGAVGGWLLALLLPAAPAIALPLVLGRRLGGHTGDTYGWCVEWSDTAGLLLCGLVFSAAGWPAG